MVFFTTSAAAVPSPVHPLTSLEPLPPSPSSSPSSSSSSSSSDTTSCSMVDIHKEDLMAAPLGGGWGKEKGEGEEGEGEAETPSRWASPPTADRCESTPPFVGNGVALAEFTSLLQPSRQDGGREQIAHLLDGVEDEAVLLEIARLVREKVGDGGRAARGAGTKRGRGRGGGGGRSLTKTGETLPLQALLGRGDRRWVSCGASTSPNSLAAGEGFLVVGRSQPARGATSTAATFVRRKSCTDAESLGLLPFVGENNSSDNAEKAVPNGSPTSSSQAVTEGQSKGTPILADEEVQKIFEEVKRAGRRVAISAPVCDMEQGNSYKATSASVKCPAKAQRLVGFVKKFAIFAELEEKEVLKVTMALVKETHPAGAKIMTQGMGFDKKFYLLAKGTCEILKNDRVIETISRGTGFGGLELMYNQAKCATTVRCKTQCVLYSLDETTYHRAVVSGRLYMRKHYEKIILKIPLLSVLSERERLSVADALTIKTFKKNQYIVCFGQKTSHVYLILEGEAKVVGRSKGRKKELIRLYKDDIIGELEFIFGDLTVADVVVTSERVVTACISRSHFELITGSISENLKKLIETNPIYEMYYRRRRVPSGIHQVLDSADHHKKAAPATGLKVAKKFFMDVDPNGEWVMAIPPWSRLPSADPKPDHNSARRDGDSRTMDDSNYVFLRFPMASLPALPMVFMCLSEDGTVCSWSAGLEKLTSYTSSEIIGQNIYSFILEKNDQDFMRSSIKEAVSYAGNVKGYLKHNANAKPKSCRFVCRDGLTYMVLKLDFMPPLVDYVDQAMKIVLAYGEEVHWVPEFVRSEPLLLFSEFRNILSNPIVSLEERQRLLMESLDSFEDIYRAATLPTERLHVVNLQQLIGKIVMDFGSDCVTRGVMIRQHFEDLPTMQVYFDAVLLPKCLHYAVDLCINEIYAKKLSIEVSLATKSGMEFLVIDFNVDGPGFPPEYTNVLKNPPSTACSTQAFGSIPHNAVGDVNRKDFHGSKPPEGGYLDDALQHSPDHNASTEGKGLEWVRAAMEEQGGTVRIVSGPGSSDLLFLIPFMPFRATRKGSTLTNIASTTNTSRSESSNHMNNSVRMTPLLAHSASLASPNGTTNPPLTDDTPFFVRRTTESNSLFISNEELEGVEAKMCDTYGRAVSNSTRETCVWRACCYTTLVVEDNPAYRNMLCAYLWQHKHAVLSAHSIEDIERLADVVDILFIDLSQSVLRSLGPKDSITMLREKMSQMAVVITSEESNLASSEAFRAAGFISLVKPCTPAQATQAISIAEEKMFIVKQEAERIAQIREELAKGSNVKWKLGRLIGKGAFSEVYEVTDILTGGTMAMKEMRLNCDKVRMESSFYEIAAMCSLQHPNIIHYFYCEESLEKGTICVFMEYASGGTLRELLKNRQTPLEFSQIKRLLRDITAGLAYIHSQNYVHSDIKTANVLLAQDGTGKIGDFGSARQICRGQLLYDMQGSPLYMSPECMSAGDISPETGERIGYSFPSDIWSLGCVALELATNRAPFSHIEEVSGPAGLMKYITTLCDTPDLSPLFNFPPCLTEFVSACLDPQPERRATAQQLLQLSIFTEAADEGTNSAVLALQRAHLLYILNKFVAFQDPPETPPNMLSKTLSGKCDSGRSKSLSLTGSPPRTSPQRANPSEMPIAEKAARSGTDKVHKKITCPVKNLLHLSRSSATTKEDSMVPHTPSWTVSSPIIKIAEAVPRGDDRNGVPLPPHIPSLAAEEGIGPDKGGADLEADFFSSSSSVVLRSPPASSSPEERHSKGGAAVGQVEGGGGGLRSGLPQFSNAFPVCSPLSSRQMWETSGGPTRLPPPHPAPPRPLGRSQPLPEEAPPPAECRWQRTLAHLQRVGVRRDRVTSALQGAANDVLNHVLRRKQGNGDGGALSSEASSNLRSRSDVHSSTVVQPDERDQPTVAKRQQLLQKLHNARRVILSRSFFRVETEGKGEEWGSQPLTGVPLSKSNSSFKVPFLDSS